MIDDHLTDEALAGQLMLGLFHCSRQSDALQLFARVADALDELHGVTPGPELHAIADLIVTKPLAGTAPGRRSTRFGAAGRSTSSVAPRSWMPSTTPGSTRSTANLSSHSSPVRAGWARACS